LTKLEVLDIGDNRLKKLENMGTLVNLTEFYCAKNKLTRIEGLENLTKLYLIAL
jgi:protein phosphatase 1 regulatory subunit 7